METHQEWDPVRIIDSILLVWCKVCEQIEEVVLPECIYCLSQDWELAETDIIRCTLCGKAWNIFTGERKPGFDRWEL